MIGENRINMVCYAFFNKFGPEKKPLRFDGKAMYRPLALISVKLIDVATALNLAIAPIGRYNPHNCNSAWCQAVKFNTIFPSFIRSTTFATPYNLHKGPLIDFQAKQ